MILMCFVLALVAFSWGVDLAGAQQAPSKNGPGSQTQANIQKQAQNEAAAIRAAQGLPRSITQAQREAAAARNAAARHAGTPAKTEGGNHE